MKRNNGRGYTRRDRSQWERLVGEQGQSGLSQRAFCDERGLAYSSFCHWKRRLEERAAHTESEPAFIELALEPATAVSWDIELTLAEGVVLRVRRR